MKPLARLGTAVLAALAVILLAPVPAWSVPASSAPSVRPHPHRRPWPVTLTVQTVPALPQVRFTVDGKVLVTDARGRASYTAEHNFARHSLVLLDTSINRTDRRYRFARWAGQRDPNQAFRPTVTGLPMRANYTVTAAFIVQYPVAAQFVDQHGAPLDLTRVSTVTVKNDAGQVLVLPKAGTVWLDGIMPAYRKSALVETNVYYSLQSLTMSGTNIVDSGKQRFTPAKTSTLVVTGQLHDLRITARDALFRGAVGTRAVVTGPDGKALTVSFDASHTATLHNLPRGSYHVTVRGAGGLVLDEQFALSRDKALRIAVLSTSDLATIGAVALVVAAALLLAGRLWLRRLLMRVPRRVVEFLRPLPTGEVPAR